MNEARGLKFELATGEWFGMDRIGRDRSPVRITSIVPLQTGRSLLKVGFFHAFYPAGVQEKEYELQVIGRTQDHLIALDEDDQPVVFSRLNTNWFQWPLGSVPAELSESPNPAAVLDASFPRT